MHMSSRRPYLIRAIYDWIVDNNFTPYILVNALYPGVEVPDQHVSDGRIVLNISPAASRGLHIGNDRIVFTTSFAGVAVQIFIPPESVLAIYARENREGMEFPFGSDLEPPLPPQPPTDGPPTRGGSGKRRGRPALKLVKKEE